MRRIKEGLGGAGHKCLMLLEPVSSACRVAIVEDDEALRAALAFALQLEGFAVCAYRCAEALEAEAGAAFDCLVVDQVLPGADGMSLIFRLRAAQAATPAVLITSYPTARLRAEAAREGVEIIEKPLLGDALLDTLRRLTRPSAP